MVKSSPKSWRPLLYIITLAVVKGQFCSAPCLSGLVFHTVLLLGCKLLRQLYDAQRVYCTGPILLNRCMKLAGRHMMGSAVWPPSIDLRLYGRSENSEGD